MHVTNCICLHIPVVCLHFGNVCLHFFVYVLCEPGNLGVYIIFFLKKGQFSEGGLITQKNFFFQPLFLGVFLIV